jgi:hypothetical protein
LFIDIFFPRIHSLTTCVLGTWYLLNSHLNIHNNRITLKSHVPDETADVSRGAVIFLGWNPGNGRGRILTLFWLIPNSIVWRTRFYVPTHCAVWVLSAAYLHHSSVSLAEAEPPLSLATRTNVSRLLQVKWLLMGLGNLPWVVVVVR